MINIPTIKNKNMNIFIFCSYLHYFVIVFCNLFFYIVFQKLLYKTKNKWCFTITIAILSYFFTTLKINLTSYMFLLTHIISILFYYMQVLTF